MKMAGVPAPRFREWASKLVALGYKVVRVDEMDSRVMANAKSRQSGGAKDKILGREVAAVLTMGTLVDGELIGSDDGHLLLSLWEDTEANYGICFVDASTADFGLCRISKDDSLRTQLESLLIQLKPKELVLPKGKLSARTWQVIRATIASPLITQLKPDTEFWSPDRCSSEIARERLFTQLDDESVEDWPDAVTRMSQDAEVMWALGGCLSYLHGMALARQLASQRRFRIHEPNGNPMLLHLDGQTLANLEVLENTRDGGSDGTLFRLLDRCKTPFGHRLLRRWVCHPLARAVDIEDRLDAVDVLIGHPDLMEALSGKLAMLPDLERLVSRLHSGSAKWIELVKALVGFQDCSLLLSDIKESGGRLTRLVNLDDVTSIASRLQVFDGLLNWRMMATSDQRNEFGDVEPILPLGVHSEFDNACSVVNSLDAQLESYLDEQRSLLGLPNLSYKTIGKESHQLEIPASAKVTVPDSFSLMSQTKDVKRFWTSEIRHMVEEMKEAQGSVKEAAKYALRTCLTAFSEQLSKWMSVVDCIGEIDCLACLAHISQSGPDGGPMCRPVLLPEYAHSIETVALRHPCLSSVTDFIPNDVMLGGEQPATMLLTGPNMGGKSTLLRQVCLAVIMAQMGCRVAADSFKFSPCDRIFTRLGARDNIMTGQSTFMVELHETAHMLKQGTDRSLVILDELGRGTSTFDGYAIAFAVLNHLVGELKCRALFSTHYHMLTEDYGSHPGVSLQHMASVVDEAQRDVTFLYKLTQGICSKSYGMNVANLAGVPVDVIVRAEAKAKEFEGNVNEQRRTPDLIDEIDKDHLSRAIAITKSGANERLKLAQLAGLIAEVKAML